MIDYIKNYPIISDQITKQELNVVLDHATKSLVADGDFVEFGCFSGTTSIFLSRIIYNSNKNLWVYDSFEGLPQKSKNDESPAGFAFKKGELAYSKKNFISNYKKANLPLPIIKKAWFNELSTNDLPDKIAFAFLDGDYYESIYDSLQLIKDKISEGGSILVHDYGRTTLPGAKKAVSQYLSENQNYKLFKTQEHIAVITAA